MPFESINLRSGFGHHNNNERGMINFFVDIAHCKTKHLLEEQCKPSDGDLNFTYFEQQHDINTTLDVHFSFLRCCTC